MAPGGYFGQALVVDAGTGTAETLPLPDELLRAYIGGAGLGAWLMHRLAPPGVDPLAPAAPLAFVFSPLVGTPLTTSAKFAVVAKSTLTGMLNDALSSSHFAISGKLTGYDAIVVHGACDRPSVLLVDDLVLDLAASALRAEDPAVTLASSNVGSLGGLVALRDGLCHLAGSHLLDPATGEYTIPYVRRVLGDADVAVVRLVHRDQGLIVAPGNPLGLADVGDLARPGLRYINR